MVGGWWANPLQTLSQGLVLTLRFTFDPELDNILLGRLYGDMEMETGNNKMNNE